MRNKYVNELTELHNMLDKMGALCETAISSAMKGLINDDEDNRTKAIETDRKIDKMEHSIEALCLRLILEQQPVASDLRLVSSALKIIGNMERIGDQASDIAVLSKSMGKSNVIASTDLNTLACAAIKMLSKSINSFTTDDTELAKSVIDDDDKVDALFDKMKSELIEIIATDSSKGRDCLDALMVAKYLERIGDHAENIAEAQISL